MNSRPLRPERSALPSALYPVEKRQHMRPFGCGRRIRTLTMRVRVAGATITQFRITVLYYYTKNVMRCQYLFERNFEEISKILSFAAGFHRRFCMAVLYRPFFSSRRRETCGQNRFCVIMHTVCTGVPLQKRGNRRHFAAAFSTGGEGRGKRIFSFL